MKIKYLLLFGLMLGMLSCGDKGKVWKHTMIVASKQVECVEPVSETKKRCFYVKFAKDKDWEVFSPAIEGFVYTRGNEYEIRVDEIQLKNQPKGAPNRKYVLKETLNITNKESEGLP